MFVNASSSCHNDDANLQFDAAFFSETYTQVHDDGGEDDNDDDSGSLTWSTFTHHPGSHSIDSLGPSTLSQSGTDEPVLLVQPDENVPLVDLPALLEEADEVIVNYDEDHRRRHGW